MDKRSAVTLAQGARVIVEPAPGDGTSLTERLRAVLDTEPSLAERHFALQIIRGVAEDELDEALLTALGIDWNDPASWPCKNITYDYYDSSFELKDVESDWEPTPEGLTKAWTLGFARCWICHGEHRDEPGYRESYYGAR